MKKGGLIILLIILVIFSTIVVFIVNKNNNKTAKEELNVTLGSEPNSLDPAISLTIDVRSYLANLFEGLVNLNEEGVPVEGVAYQWESNDENTEYTFKLRKNAKWSDGSPITANDFKYEWIRVLNPQTASGWASYLYYIKGAEKYNKGEATEENVGIEIIDDYTLKVEMENPCSFFISLTALQPYYPVKEQTINSSKEKWYESADTCITNGAFKLENLEHDSIITVIKNENYWNKEKIKISKINFNLFSDSSVILNSYEAGKLDYVENMLTSEEMKQIENIQKSDFVYTKFLALNLNSEAFEDENIRKAIGLALDRNEISKLMGEEIEPLTNFIPKGFYNSVEKEDYTQDSNSKKYFDYYEKIEEAKELLKKAGYENGNGLNKITYLTNNSSTNIALAEIIKNQLEKIGINIDIQALEKKVFNTYRKEKKFDIVAASWAAEYPDISSYLYGFKSTDLNNYSGFKNDEFDNLYNLIISNNDIKERYILVHKAEDLVMQSYSIVPLYKENSCYIAKDNLKGFYHDVTGCLNLNYVYFK